ncbi:MAG: hypothetical protein JO006_10790 [Paucibacter sp.]|nr:hypothetical protein [Roseateles sp.]
MIGLLMALSPAAQALGVNAPQTRSNLGQPLDLFFPVSLAPGEALSTECVRVDVLAGDTRVPPGLVSIVLEGTNETSVRAVRVTSVVQINEPIVTVSLALGCPARLTRQYVALIDPPGGAPTPAPAPELVAQEINSQSYSPALRAALATADSKPEQLLAQPPVTSAPAPAPAAVMRTPAPPASAASTPQERTASSGPSDAGVAKPAKPKHRKPKPVEHETVVASAQPAASTANGPVSRLRLDAPERVDAKSPVAASSPQNAASEVAAAALAAIAASEATQSRLSALEEGINRLQHENQAQAERMAQLQARLEAAQSGRNGNLLVWLFGMATLGLGGLAAYFWRSREREREQWWAAEAARQPVAEAVQTTRVLETVHENLSTMQTPQAVPSAVADAPVSTLAEFMAPTTPFSHAADTVAFQADTSPIPFMDSQIPPAQATMVQLAADGPPVTVEELLDMEQQVEFFLVLGQTEAAIDLLRARVDTGTSSALPYLKLLEIHQMQGDVGAFSELADRFSKRFNALPPAWGRMAGEGLGLETAAEALRQIQAVWSDPAASMELLQKLLTHGEQGVNGPEAFDLPAYRDLLLLYSVARALSEREVRGTDIDLFLPLDANSPTGMMATMPMQRAGAPAPLGGVAVDISLDPIDPRSA